jgi:hypothetical protein
MAALLKEPEVLITDACELLAEKYTFYRHASLHYRALCSVRRIGARGAQGCRKKLRYTKDKKNQAGEQESVPPDTSFSEVAK